MTLPTYSMPLHASRRNGVAGGDIFCFGRYRLVSRERLLLKDDALVSVGSRAFDLLLALVERAGETVDRRDLFERVWPDVFVAKVNLRVHVAGLRRALGDDQDGNRFIVSVTGRGYRFVVPVSRLQAAAPVCVIDLAGVDDPAQIATAVAAALGCEVEPQEPLICVLAYLRDKKMLLAFDNCEHVFAGVAQLTKRLLTAAPRVEILISSRQAHRLSTAFAAER